MAEAEEAGTGLGNVISAEWKRGLGTNVRHGSCVELGGSVVQPMREAKIFRPPIRSLETRLCITQSAGISGEPGGLSVTRPLEVFGPDNNSESYAVCGSDMLINGHNIDRLEENEDIFARFMNDADFQKLVAEKLLREVSEQIRAEGSALSLLSPRFKGPSSITPDPPKQPRLAIGRLLFPLGDLPASRGRSPSCGHRFLHFGCQPNTQQDQHHNHIGHKPRPSRPIPHVYRGDQ
jgi:hypothetical protein